MIITWENISLNKLKSNLYVIALTLKTFANVDFCTEKFGAPFIINFFCEKKIASILKYLYEKLYSRYTEINAENKKI